MHCEGSEFHARKNVYPCNCTEKSDPGDDPTANRCNTVVIIGTNLFHRLFIVLNITITRFPFQFCVKYKRYRSDFDETQL